MVILGIKALWPLKLVSLRPPIEYVRLIGEGIELGSGIGALSELLRDNPDLFGSRTVDSIKSEVKPFTPAEVYSWIKCAFFL